MTALIIPGANPAVTPAQYHADALPPEPSLSNTLMGAMLRSPRHAWTQHPRLNPAWKPRTSDAFDVGHATHAVVLGKGAGAVEVDAPDWRGKDARAERDAIRAAGGIPLLPEQFAAVELMAASVRNILWETGRALAEVFEDKARNEIPHYAVLDGVICRAMPDHVGADGWLYDLKTTTDANPDAVKQSVASYGYARQAAHYLAVHAAATGERAKGMRFVFVEKSPPHEGCVVQLVDDEAAEDDWSRIAREECAVARRDWRACLDAGEWPGYRRAILEVGAPAWLALQSADRLAARPDAPRRDKPAPATLAKAAALQSPT